MRDVNNLKGLHIVKTMQSTKKRSIPRIQSSAYLDLYMLNKEKERLIKEDEKLCMRREAIKKRLQEIDLDTNKLQEAEAIVKTTGRTSTQKNEVKKEWKKMSLNY